MNAEQRKGAESLMRQAAELGKIALAEALSLGIAASEECERWKSAMGFAAIDAVSLKHQRDEAWLAAWDAEWRAQEWQKSHAALYRARLVLSGRAEELRLRALLERAAGLLREGWVRSGDLADSRDALLAEIKGAGE